ncbi:hypothetical protein GCM10009641_44180 [Mycobacterium cookii]|uniref:Uncharacterized protein n=1 Tax=Nocardioides furvisabuli TaxID=375542 RepID=A0ABN2XTF9_9ACTN|nr:hypothetical protein [Nocardioides furvisabuli]
MSDGDQTQPVRPGAPAPTPAPTPAPPPAAEAPSGSADGPGAAPTAERRGFRERLRTLRRSDGSRTFGLAALIASALAGVIVGGLGFAAVHAVSDDRGRDRDRGAWVERRGDDGPGERGLRRGPRGVPGQLPPTTVPQDDDSVNS